MGCGLPDLSLLNADWGLKSGQALFLLPIFLALQHTRCAESEQFQDDGKPGFNASG